MMIILLIIIIVQNFFFFFCKETKGQREKCTELAEQKVKQRGRQVGAGGQAPTAWTEGGKNKTEGEHRNTHCGCKVTVADQDSDWLAEQRRRKELHFHHQHRLPVRREFNPKLPLVLQT